MIRFAPVYLYIKKFVYRASQKASMSFSQSFNYSRNSKQKSYYTGVKLLDWVINLFHLK